MIHVKADPKKLLLPIAFRCPVCSEEVRLSPQNGPATLPSAFCKCITVSYEDSYAREVERARAQWGKLISSTRKRTDRLSTSV